MSKLDTILDKSFLHDQSLAKLDIKILFLEIFGEALRTKDVAEMGKTFRQKVEAL